MFALWEFVCIPTYKMVGRHHSLNPRGRTGLDWIPSPSTRLGLAVVVLLHLICGAMSTAASQIHTIHWNTSNPMFRKNTDNIIDINGGNHHWEYDQVNIVCPVYKPGSAVSDKEQYIIYSVSKDEYESCRITQASPKIVALCNRPHELMYFTITFRSFTPTPGGLEFHPGHDYYFISTSSKNDLHRRVGGGCASSNMKVIFRVAPSKEQVSEQESNAIDQDNPSSVLASQSQKSFPWSQESDFRRSFSYYYPSREIQESRQHLRQSKKSLDYSSASISLPLDGQDEASTGRQAEAMHSSADSLSTYVPYWLLNAVGTLVSLSLLWGKMH